MTQPDTWRMIWRRAAAAGIAAPNRLPYVPRATEITAYLSNRGALEYAQEMAVHENPRTTKRPTLYDRTKERLTQDEVGRLRCVSRVGLFYSFSAATCPVALQIGICTADPARARSQR